LKAQHEGRTVQDQQVRATAQAIERSTEGLNDSADRRTELAANRTILAAERTYCSWVQLGLGALAAGIGTNKLLQGFVPVWIVDATGTLLVLFSAFAFFAAVWREMRPGAPPPRPDIRRLPPLLLLTINGFLAIVSLAALTGIWFGSASGQP
jgi:putative membrane protein